MGYTYLLTYSIFLTSRDAPREGAVMDAYERMEARRKGLERIYLHVTFLRAGNVEKERILEERYAMTRMEAWMSRGLEYRVRNHPVKLPTSGLAAGMMRNRQRRATSTRWLQESAA